MQLLKWFFVLIMGVAVVMFAIANRSSVTLNFNPLPFTVDIPLFIIIFIGAVLGFVMGGLLASLKNLTNHRKIAKQQKQIEALEKELAALKAGQAVQNTVEGSAGEKS